MSLPEIYADGIHEISFGNGVIRLDLYSLSTLDKAADGKPKRDLRQRVVLSPQGFLESLAVMQGMVAKLEQAGIIRRQEAQAAAEPAKGKKAG